MLAKEKVVTRTTKYKVRSNSSTHQIIALAGIDEVKETTTNDLVVAAKPKNKIDFLWTI